MYLSSLKIRLFYFYISEMGKAILEYANEENFVPFQVIQTTLMLHS